MMQFRQVTPLIVVSDIPKAVAFLSDCLGFTAEVLRDGYAYLTRDNAALRLLAAAPDFDIEDPKRQQSCYIDVEDVDAIFAAHRDQLEKLPASHLRQPFDQDYGQREFHFIYESLLIFVGEPIRKEQTA